MQPHVCAVGELTNLPKRLETTAGKEGTLAVENALTGSAKSIDYDAVPSTVFTDPQLAGVGLTEAEQMQRLGISACRTISFEGVPRMGVHILALHAASWPREAMMLVKNRNTVDDVLDSLPMFPTLSEGIKLVARQRFGETSRSSAAVSSLRFCVISSRRRPTHLQHRMRRLSHPGHLPETLVLAQADLCPEKFAG